jgi:hypothetical protein
MTDLLLAFNETLALTGLAVAWHYGRLAWTAWRDARAERRGLPTRRLLIERARHASAVAYLGLGLGIGQAWNVVRQLDRPLAVMTVDAVYAATVLALAGAMLLIRIATVARHGERCWVAWGLLMAAIFMAEAWR